ncbi:MAG: hypothetical protein U0802_24275 [Candidatus Binatia bacterium]
MSPDALAARLAALERSHRRLRGVVAALTLALLAALLLGAGSDGVLSGRTLKLLDEQGKLRVLLTASTGVSFLDAAGRTRASLGLDQATAPRPGALRRRQPRHPQRQPRRPGAGDDRRARRPARHHPRPRVKGQPGLVFFLDGEERERVHFDVVEGTGQGLLRAADGGTTWQMPAGN